MKVGVYLCRCGGIISDRIDYATIGRRLAETGEVAYCESIELACSVEGKASLADDLRAKQPDRAVVVACSPREHETTFRGIAAEVGMNPFFVQMVNVREHIAWVTEDPVAATDKAFHQIRAAVARVKLHESLDRQQVDVNTDVMVIGAGPAGLKAALTLAEAGRKVTLVEKAPILGGMPVRYEEVFPKMECGPCVLEPFIAEALHGPHSGNIEIFFQTALVGVKGAFGNFEVRLQRSPRYVRLETCIGCTACIPACPATEKNETNCGLNERKAIDFVFYGGLPNVPYLSPAACLRFKGQECSECVKACPVEGAIDFSETTTYVDRTVGAILLAIGGSLYDCRRLPALGYGSLPDVVTSLELERMLSTNGPTEGMVRLSDGRPLEKVAIIHCAGSLESGHADYCSGVCCLGAFKLNTLLSHKVPGIQIVHYVKTIVAPGKEEHALVKRVLGRGNTRIVSFESSSQLQVTSGEGGKNRVRLGSDETAYDLVVLMPAVVPAEATPVLSTLLDVGLGQHGFFEELHGLVDISRSKVRGVYLAGTCQAPMNLGSAMTQGAAAAGGVLSALVPGRKLELEAIYAVVDETKCSGCRSCVSVCPYKAVSLKEDEKTATVNPLLCLGCGTCVAACPSQSIAGRHFTNEQIFAEIEGLLT